MAVWQNEFVKVSSLAAWQDEIRKLAAMAVWPNEISFNQCGRTKDKNVTLK